MIREMIEILPVSLLDDNRPLVEMLKRRARSMRMKLGWHYLLDLTWVLNCLGDLDGKNVMDAGAGVGLLQWMLAERSARVFSVDRDSRAGLPMQFRSRYHVQGLREEDLSPIPPLAAMKEEEIGLGARLRMGILGSADLFRSLFPKQGRGVVLIYNHGLDSLADIPDNSVDAVGAISALEHNSPDGLKRVVDELMRVLKPGGILAATLCAARDEDWFHEPSKGWCYTDVSLRRLFNLPVETHSNYNRYDEFMDALRNCAELRNNLAPFYCMSGDNGMPWGKWDPVYQTVGVCKLKHLA